MIAEAAVLLLLKSTLTASSSAWAVLVVAGQWAAAIAAIPALALCGANLWLQSRRLRGKRAEGGP